MTETNMTETNMTETNMTETKTKDFNGNELLRIALDFDLIVCPKSINPQSDIDPDKTNLSKTSSDNAPDGVLIGFYTDGIMIYYNQKLNKLTITGYGTYKNKYNPEIKNFKIWSVNGMSYQIDNVLIFEGVTVMELTSNVVEDCIKRYYKLPVSA